MAEDYDFVLENANDYLHKRVAQRHSAEVAHLQRSIASAWDQIRLILPMAKGYAAEHPVGSNAAIVEGVDNWLWHQEHDPVESAATRSDIEKE